MDIEVSREEFEYLYELLMFKREYLLEKEIPCSETLKLLILKFETLRKEIK